MVLSVHYILSLGYGVFLLRFNLKDKGQVHRRIGESVSCLTPVPPMPRSSAQTVLDSQGLMTLARIGHNSNSF